MCVSAPFSHLKPAVTDQMKGVIFNELIDRVRASYGLETLDAIIGEIHSETDGAYTAVGTYPDQELYDLIGALSRRTGQAVSDILRDFGRHLFGQLAARYSSQIGQTSDAFGLLESLDSVIHPNVQKLYPEAILPHFAATRLGEDELHMRYESPRGLPDLAEGLIRGCAEWFSETIVIEKRLLDERGTTTEFHLRRQKVHEAN